MGEAKRRGPRAHRVAEGIAKRAKLRKQQTAEAGARWRALPAERRRRATAAAALAVGLMAQVSYR